MIAKDGFPICLNEHCTQIANVPQTFVIQIQTDWPKEALDPEKSKVEFNELVLKERSGRKRHVYFEDCPLNIIQKHLQDQI